MKIIQDENNLITEIIYTKEDKNTICRVDVMEWMKKRGYTIKKLEEKIDEAIEDGRISKIDSSTIRKAIYAKERMISEEVLDRINVIIDSENLEINNEEDKEKEIIYHPMLEHLDNRGKEELKKTISLVDKEIIDKIIYYGEMDKYNLNDTFEYYIGNQEHQRMCYEDSAHEAYKRIFKDLMIGFNRNLLLELHKNINVLEHMSKQRQCLTLYIQLRGLWVKNIDLIQYIDNVECWDGYYENLEEMKNYKLFEKSNAELLDEVVEQLYQKVYLGIGDTEVDKIIEIYLECDEEDIINIYKLINLYRNDVDRYETLCNIVESILEYEK